LWPWVTEADKLSAWSGVTITPRTPGPSGHPDEPGATRHVEIPVGRRTVPATERVLESTPPERFVYSVFEGGMVRGHTGTVVLEPTETGTRLSWTVELLPAVPATGWLIRRTLEPQFEQGLDELGVLLQGDAAR
jgi:hypothetical protein